MAGTKFMSQHSASFLKHNYNDNVEMKMDLSKLLGKEDLEEQC